jgi:hypothetical protein
VSFEAGYQRKKNEEFRRRNPNYAAEYSAQWHLDHPEYDAQYYQDNIEASRARALAYAKANPDKVNANAARRRGRLKKATPPDADHTKINFMFSVAAEINRQLGTDFEVDHIHPIRKKGLHHHHNLQLLTKSANCSKGIKVGIPATGFTVRMHEAMACAVSFLPGGMRSDIVLEE